MTTNFGPTVLLDFSDPAQLELFLRDAIRRKQEHDKLDFKQDLEFTTSTGEKNPKGRTNLVRLVCSLANSESPLFGDYGFLILGADSEGQIHHVPELDKGSDKLHAQIGDILREYLEPVPDFQVHVFQEASAAWGCILIPPGQAARGPFIFKKESTEKGCNWRRGEWRVRRSAKVVEPDGSDYARVERAKLEQVLQPLRAQLHRHEQAIAQLQGKLDMVKKHQLPQIELQAEPCKTPVILHGGNLDKLRARAIEAARQSPELYTAIDDFLQEAKRRITARSAPVATAAVTSAGTLGKLAGLDTASLLKAQQLSDVIGGPRTRRTVSPSRIKAVQSFLEEVLQEPIDPSWMVFDDLYTRTMLLDRQSWEGDDYPLFQKFCALEKHHSALLLDRMERQRNREQLDGCFEFTLRVRNAGPVKTGDLQLTVEATEDSDVTLLEQMPVPRHELPVEEEGPFPRFKMPKIYHPAQPEPTADILEEDSCELEAASLSPGQTGPAWTLPGRFAVKDLPATGSRRLKLNIKVISDELPQPLVQVVETEVHFARLDRPVH
ncbi:helix-turn-helix domain-containing protein [Deinococcus sp. NW-56]|uniref:AlbA family DNA-binding domain-containing protein n=1 Tax=Deinococcus sp. NW-56 TaxID=2080419 RepID=UPI000CF517BB|nr:RNA-binding domain-containing protein [Deinococcus sp. NW-56]